VLGILPKVKSFIKKYQNLRKDKEFKKYFNNTFWLFIEKFFKLGAGFFLIIALTRYLGPENYGLLSYSQSFVGMFVALSTLGLEVILVRELTKNKSQASIILGTAFALKFVASLIALILILVSNLFIEDEEATLLSNIIAYTLIFQSINLGFDTYFQANVLSKYSAISNTFIFILSTVIKLCLIFFEADLIYFAYILVVDAGLIFVGYLFIYTLQKQSILRFKYDGKMAVYFLKSGWPMMMVAMAVFFYTKIDQIMIKHLLDNTSVGYYSAALKVSEIFYFIPLLIAQSIFPKIVQEREKGNTENYFRLLLNLYKIVLWISIPIVIFVVLFSGVIVKILFGPDFSQTASILPVLMFCLILVSIGSVSTKILYIEHYEKKYLQRSMFGMVINIGLNFILISMYGVIGAAIATLATLFMIHYVYDLFDKDLWRFYHLKLKCFIPKINN